MEHTRNWQTLTKTYDNNLGMHVINCVLMHYMTLFFKIAQGIGAKKHSNYLWIHSK